MGGAVLVATSWLLATVVAGAVVWRAVVVLDPQDQVGVLSAEEVARQLAASTTPTASPSSQVTATPSPTTSASMLPTSPAPAPVQTPSPEPPSPTTVVRTWTVTGGSVAVSCSGQAATLLGATPSDGWSVEVHEAGPTWVVVELTSRDHETRVKATCVDGVPTQVHGDDDDGDDDDHHH
jgi:hypothetical protein